MILLGLSLDLNNGTVILMFVLIPCALLERTHPRIMQELCLT
jgi:hypothetical protein